MISTLYPEDWETIARLIKEANHWQCQECGRQCRRPGEFNLGWEWQLTVSHYDGVYETSEVFLAVLCVRCHFKHDVQFIWSARRRADRLRQEKAGQQKLQL